MRLHGMGPSEFMRSLVIASYEQQHIRDIKDTLEEVRDDIGRLRTDLRQSIETQENTF